MRKVLFFISTSLDGYYDAGDRDITWHHVDAEVKDFSVDQLNSVDMLLFGRVTYEMMASYWPTPAAIQNDPVIADKMNHLAKIVFSRTLSGATWENTRLVKANFADEILKLKRQPGKDLIVSGSDLAVSFMEHGLIDEFRIMVNPVALGGGKSLFNGIRTRLELRLQKTRTFACGNVLLYYEPAAKSEK